MNQEYTPINSRVPAIYEIMTTAGIPFEGKGVVDLGCGYGDLLYHFHTLGKAGEVLGLDNEPENIFTAFRRFNSHPVRSFRFMPFDLATIELWNGPRRDLPGRPPEWDVATCCSVLSYLDARGRDKVLAWMSRRASISFIECQYRGDGSGRIRDDHDMASWLHLYWKHVLPLGYTVADGGHNRTVWKCTDSNLPAPFIVK